MVVLGDTFTGKTSLVHRFVDGHYRESGKSPTMAASFITKRLSVQGMTCKIQIWDTAGQEQFKRLAPMYYRNAAAAIVCYDMQSPKSFDTLKYWVDELRTRRTEGDFVTALCGTKADLSMAPPDTRAAEDLAQEIGAVFMTTSAKDDTNVSDLFHAIADRVLRIKLNNEQSTIPVTLATMPVETGESSVTSTGKRALASQRSPASSRMASPEKSLERVLETREDEKKQEEDDDVLHPSESRESSTKSATNGCDALMICGDADLIGGNGGQGCCIQ